STSAVESMTARTALLVRQAAPGPAVAPPVSGDGAPQRQWPVRGLYRHWWRWDAQTPGRPRRASDGVERVAAGRASNCSPHTPDVRHTVPGWSRPALRSGRRPPFAAALWSHWPDTLSR